MRHYTGDGKTNHGTGVKNTNPNFARVAELQRRRFNADHRVIFFVLVDGWYMVVGSLVRSFGG